MEFDDSWPTIEVGRQQKAISFQEKRINSFKLVD